LNTLSAVKPVGLAKASIYTLLLLNVYYSTLTWLVTKDWAREAYSYCCMIPFVVLYLIWDKRDDLISRPSMPSWKGLVPLVFGLMLFWPGELGGEYLTLYISFWLVLVGICWMHLGWQKLKTIAFALIFMLTMFPVPHFLYNKVSLKLKLISSQLGAAMIQFCGLPVYREGNIIDLGFTQLQVVNACSGLPFLFSLIPLCLLMVYFFKAHFWKRAVLFISAVPLAIFSNSLRITLTGILCKVWDPVVAEGFFHGFYGWLIFVFCIPVLLIEMKILKKLPPISNHREAQSSKQKAQSKKNQPDKSWLNAKFIVVVILLTATFALSQGIEFREKIPIRKPFNQFPLKVGQWSGVRQIMDQTFINTLDLSDYTIIDYLNSPGRKVNFYVAYYESQSKGKSVHSPATCFPGSGWDFNQAGVITIPISSGNRSSMRVNRAFMQKTGRKQLVYYWFPQRGRILTNAYQLKIFAFWDSITKQRTDGALIRISTPVYKFENLEEAEARLHVFAKDIVGIVEEYLPEKI